MEFLLLGVVTVVALVAISELASVAKKSLTMIDKYRTDWSGLAAFERRGAAVGKTSYTELAAADRAAATQGADISPVGPEDQGPSFRQLEQPVATESELTPAQQADLELSRLAAATHLVE